MITIGLLVGVLLGKVSSILAHIGDESCSPAGWFDCQCRLTKIVCVSFGVMGAVVGYALKVG